MSFDARSRERLEALGRTLPEKLPPPPPRSASGVEPAPGRSPAAPRHRVETEENPEDLFRALIQASPDGSVPSHLLDRLRSLEANQPLRRGTPAPGSTSAAAIGSAGHASDTAAPMAPSRPARRSDVASRTSPTRRVSGPDAELYESFDDLLHLEQDDVPPQPAARRLPDGRLLPKPTLRRERPAG